MMSNLCAELSARLRRNPSVDYLRFSRLKTGAPPPKALSMHHTKMSVDTLSLPPLARSLAACIDLKTDKMSVMDALRHEIGWCQLHVKRHLLTE